MAMHLYDSDKSNPVAALRGFVRPEGWQIDTDPKVDRKYAQQGLPLVYFLWSLSLFCDRANILAEWNSNEADDLYKWAKAVTNKEFKTPAHVMKADLKTAFNGDIEPLKTACWKMQDEGILA